MASLHLRNRSNASFPFLNQVGTNPQVLAVLAFENPRVQSFAKKADHCGSVTLF